MISTSEDLDEMSEQDEGYLVIEVSEGQDLLRIDKYLLDRIPNISRSKIQDGIKNGDVEVNGEIIKSNYKVHPADIIRIKQPEQQREIELIPQDIPLDIVYEDDSIMIINKQAGLVVHPGYGNYSGTLVNALLFHAKDLPLRDGDEFRPGIVHRLDKNTTGIMVIAKTSQALAHLSKQFFDRTTDRRYVALAWGDMPDEEGTIEAHIGRSLKNRKIRAVFPDGEFGKRAVTHYKTLKRFDYVTLVECKLDTGRTHQIRVHMSHIGHPLFNDMEYGGDRVLKGTTFTKYKQFVQNCFKLIPRQSLHAKSLSLDHPVTGERMHFNSEYPEDLQTVLSRWDNYLENRISK